MNRETITAALYARLGSITGLKTVSRKPKGFEETSPAECPALYLAIGNSSVEKAGPVPIWRLTWTVYIYVYDSSKAGPSSSLNGYIGAVETALDITAAELAGRNGSDYGGTTLGGLVYHANVTDVLTDEGSFGDLGVAILTIEAKAA